MWRRASAASPTGTASAAARCSTAVHGYSSARLGSVCVRQRARAVVRRGPRQYEASGEASVARCVESSRVSVRVGVRRPGWVLDLLDLVAPAAGRQHRSPFRSQLPRGRRRHSHSIRTGRRQVWEVSFPRPLVAYVFVFFLSLILARAGARFRARKLAKACISPPGA